MPPRLVGQPERDEDVDLASPPASCAARSLGVGLLDRTARVGTRAEPLRGERRGGGHSAGEGEREKDGGGVRLHRSPNGK